MVINEKPDGVEEWEGRVNIFAELTDVEMEELREKVEQFKREIVLKKHSLGKSVIQHVGAV